MYKSHYLFLGTLTWAGEVIVGEEETHKMGDTWHKGKDSK